MESDAGEQADRAQAAALIALLEDVATQLVRQVDALEGAARLPQAHQRDRLLSEARMRRLELYETRSHIEALQTRFSFSSPLRGHRRRSR